VEENIFYIGVWFLSQIYVKTMDSHLRINGKNRRIDYKELCHHFLPFMPTNNHALDILIYNIKMLNNINTIHHEIISNKHPNITSKYTTTHILYLLK